MIIQEEFNRIVKDVMKEERRPEDYNVFIAPLEVVMQDDTTLTLYADFIDTTDPFATRSDMLFFKEHYYPRVAELLNQAGYNIKIRLTNKK